MLVAYRGDRVVDWRVNGSDDYVHLLFGYQLLCRGNTEGNLRAAVSDKEFGLLEYDLDFLLIALALTVFVQLHVNHILLFPVVLLFYILASLLFFED